MWRLWRSYTRKRWYAIFRREKKDIRWPYPVEQKKTGNHAENILTGQIWEKSIFDRKKVMAEARRRITNGIRKYILESKPYIVEDKGALAFIIQYHGETKEGDSRGRFCQNRSRRLIQATVTDWLRLYHQIL